MTPPINIDGSDILGGTIDGQTVRTITIDGQEVFNFIPDSAIAQYDATQISASDGDPVNTWSDEQNLADLSAVNAPTYRASDINGNAAVEFDGSDDEMTASIGTYSQPITYGIVYKILSTATRQNIVDRQSGSLQYRTKINNSEFDHFDGNNGFDGGTPSTTNSIAFLTWDGNNTVHYINGSNQNISTFSSSTDLVDLQVGNNAFDQYANMYLGELIIYDDALSSSERTNEESRLSDKWGISV